RISESKAKQILEPRLPCKRVALEVHEHVVCRWLRQSAESRSFYDRQQLVHRRLLRSPFHLHARLLPHPLESFSRAVQRLLLQRNGQRRQFRRRLRLPVIQLIPLQSRDSRDQRKMVVAPPPCIALSKPAAH